MNVPTSNPISSGNGGTASSGMNMNTNTSVVSINTNVTSSSANMVVSDGSSVIGPSSTSNNMNITSSQLPPQQMQQNENPTMGPPTTMLNVPNAQGQGQIDQTSGYAYTNRTNHNPSHAQMQQQQINGTYSHVAYAQQTTNSSASQSQTISRTVSQNGPEATTLSEGYPTNASHGLLPKTDGVSLQQQQHLPQYQQQQQQLLTSTQQQHQQQVPQQQRQSAPPQPQTQQQQKQQQQQQQQRQLQQQEQKGNMTNTRGSNSNSYQGQVHSQQPNNPRSVSGGSGSGASSTGGRSGGEGTDKGNETCSYSAERIIGNGSFGVVFQATEIDSGRVVAIKKVLQDKRFKNRELQIMRQLAKQPHPNIVILKQCFYSNGEKPDELFLNLVLEFVQETVYSVARSYSKAKQNLPILYVKLYIYQLGRALAYIHGLGICHRDIKPQNLLVDPETHTLKLCDFGSAKFLVSGEPNVAYICSRYYRAPELIFGSTHYTTAIDIWSQGCVAAELLMGQPLFPGESGVDQLVEIIRILGTPTREEIKAMNSNYTEFKFPQIKAQPWNKIFRSRVPAEAVDVVSKMLAYGPERRIKPFEGCSHPFFHELRDPSVTLPNGRSLPRSLFDFSEYEKRVMNPPRSLFPPFAAGNTVLQQHPHQPSGQVSQSSTSTNLTTQQQANFCEVTLPSNTQQQSFPPQTQQTHPSQLLQEPRQDQQQQQQHQHQQNTDGK